MTYVAYREEDSALTMSRVKNNEKPEEGWITSEARVEYVTEGYEDTNMDAALEETRTNQSEADDDYDDDNHDVINDQNKSYEDADMGAQSDTYDDYDDDDGDHEKHAIINFQIKSEHLNLTVI
ncbi:calsequestrin-1 isoform X2 [Bicyclus anynana]|uniref:Calsequestrin-1 isoform X2 n=1 Tax=Bicyclus anynana TaxID=110368 RepID=A0ABM3LQQ4_BICAN|nr:calsequestrin-1 isoform X2 [Bicyclus anynana]